MIEIIIKCSRPPEFKYVVSSDTGYVILFVVPDEEVILSEYRICSLSNSRLIQ
ncbi:hypothetical protein D3C87_557350 [compost metagenome]